MITKILVAVDDSAASIRAARLAAELSASTGSKLAALAVLPDGVVAEAVSRVSGEPEVTRRRQASSASVLAHAARVAAGVNVIAELHQRVGEPGPEILSEASECGADLVVMGRADGQVPGESYVGAVAAYVLELAEIPVLLVP